MAAIEWHDEYGGHLRAMRDDLLVGEVCWYQDRDTGAKYWAGFAGRDRIEGRFDTIDEAQAAVEEGAQHLRRDREA